MFRTLHAVVVAVDMQYQMSIDLKIGKLNADTKGIVISLPLFLRERRVNFCESLETVYQVKFNATQLL